MDKEIKSPSSLTPNDLPIAGLLIGLQNDSITYTSKKTGQQIEAKRDILILQTEHGIILARSFSSESSGFLQTVKVGDRLMLPMTSYQIENGVKTASVRL